MLWGGFDDDITLWGDGYQFYSPSLNCSSSWLDWNGDVCGLQDLIDSEMLVVYRARFLRVGSLLVSVFENARLLCGDVAYQLSLIVYRAQIEGLVMTSRLREVTETFDLVAASVRWRWSFGFYSPLDHMDYYVKTVMNLWSSLLELININEIYIF